jgi:ligand-binding SRPBCC domain-containing protein
MPLIEVTTEIHSDIHTCFDLARNIDIHKESLKDTIKIPFAGKTSGHIGLGEWVSWESIHFGMVKHLTSKITEFNRPNYFVDEMVSANFKSFRHQHIFKQEDNKTIMINKFYFEAPYGMVGNLANVLVLKKYMRKLLVRRANLLKQYAEKSTQEKKMKLSSVNKNQFKKL